MSRILPTHCLKFPTARNGAVFYIFREAAIRQVIAAYHPVGLSLICCWWQTIANLRSASASPLMTQVCICGAFSFSSRLSALRNTHNPLELHGKRMTERLPLQCSGTLSDGTLCHLPTVVPHRFFRRRFRLYRLRIAQPFSKCRHTGAGWEVRPPAPDRGVAHAVRQIPVIYRWRESGRKENDTVKAGMEALAGIEPCIVHQRRFPLCALPTELQCRVCPPPCNDGPQKGE